MKYNKDNYNVRYYYIKNTKPRCPGQHSLACVCMVKNRSTGVISRGISFCSTKEKFFNKIAARGIAYQRAIGADIVGLSSESFRPTESTQYAVSTSEPFHKLVNQGMILGLSYKDGVVFKSDYDITPTEFEVGVWDDDKR